MFRVVEKRKLQLIEAHVRLYAIYHDRVGHKNEVHLFQQRAMRTNHPNDELGGMLLLLLPSTVVHHVDAWSPLMPPQCQTISNSAMNSYRWPEILQRRTDAMQGNSTYVECVLSGEGFCSETMHKVHHENNDWPYPCVASPIQLFSAEERIAQMREYFINTEMEILVVVEGIDPTMSTTLQACYSYKADDIMYNTHDFAPCVFRDAPYDSGRPVIDFDKFHELVEIDHSLDDHAEKLRRVSF